MMHRPWSSLGLFLYGIICILLLANLLSPVTAQDESSLPPACQTAISSPRFMQECQQALLDSVQLTVDDYTNRGAERDAAFDFGSNLTFLTTCLFETEATMLDRLCSAGEIKVYIDSLIDFISSGSSGLVAPPISTVNCNETHWSQGCEDGWSRILQVSTNQTSDLYQNMNTIPLRNEETSAACCAGFFCPRGLSCMIPCPLGAQCPKSTLVDGLCTPYGYQVTPGRNYSCGGANLWADLSHSGGAFCPGGSYCPATTDIRRCDKGFYCRQGSTRPSKCFQLTSCDAEATTQHIQSYGLMIIVALATILLLVYNCSDHVMHIREKRKIKTREKVVRQVQEQFNAVERWKFAVDAAKRIGRTFSRRQSKGPEEMQVLPHFVQRSNEARHKYGTIDEENEGGKPQVDPLRVVEEDLYVPVEVPPIPIEDESSNTKKRPVAQTKSQILRYAYREIEKEKALQNKRMSWDTVVKAEQGMHANRRRKIEITFRDLSLYLKGNGKKILCNVTGKLSSGRVTAVMGPSGAGKTTFLNALAGKAYSSTTTGEILINGRPDPISCYKKIIGFVPQDDIVHGDLTVEENLWFSARYRLSVSMSKADQVLVVERIIDSLGLGAVRNSRVGTVEKRGISGGQRKRVNVGLEMVMEPSLLILDEPTSGLDSTSSQFVLKALRREALVGVNVGVVLHQPSYGLFKLFDDVMFLAKGGRTIYLGPVEQVENYFASMGIVVPERINPPDHVMDVLEGISKPEENPGFDPRTLPVKWIQHNNYPMPADLRAIAASMGGSSEGTRLRSEDTESSRSVRARKSFTEELWQEFTSFWEMRWDDIQSTFRRTVDLSGRRTLGFWSQFKLIIMRVALQRFREARLQTQDYLILLLCGACLGLITPSRDSSLGSNNYTYVIIALSLLCMISALRTFSNDKLQYWRESASGINRVAYFLAKDTVDHFNTVIKPVVFLSMFYFFNNPRSSFVENFVVTLALVYCVSGIAYVFAITFHNGPAQLWSVFLPIIFTLVATKRETSGFIKGLQYVMYARWVLEAYVIANAKKYSGVWLITRCVTLRGAGYDLNHWILCLTILFLMGFLARCISLLCLMLCNRKRQQ
ncbi:hypothetical protein GOP47_0024710 [Adiantum capillus-veneris]|uniref:ABC transporter domain-containing protein n=1 Tax=Adiantum capillus-veneris TaxID=13818 RepID=A0A9D4U2M4_ADICA|nr:hypothetical protein GOP47_0024710 [Adiantum capillus-veneris]